MILLIDNYDSFSYNLYQLIGSINPNIKVIRNDEMTIEEISEINPHHIIISPGPGKPSEAKICREVVKKLGKTTPILGVCLGHQVICEAFDSTVSYAKEPVHGKAYEINVDTNSYLFKGLTTTIKAARYHSLAVIKSTLSDELKITAETKDGEIMAIEHSIYPVYGVQFHPESILTPCGITIIKNFLGGNYND